MKTLRSPHGVLRAIGVLLFALGMAIPAAAQSAVSYTYDDLGRLSKVIDVATGRCAVYAYDAVGNITAITRQTNCTSTPVVSSLTPTGAANCFVAAGQNLVGATVAVDIPGMSVEGLRATDTAISFCLAPQTPMCSASLSGNVTVATGEGASVSLPVTFSAPPELTRGVPVSGTIGGPGQRERFCFNTPAPEQIVVRISSATLQPCLHLLTSPDAQSVPGASSCGSFTTAMAPSLIAGTYLVEVSDAANRTGPYQLVYETFRGGITMPAAITVGAWLQTGLQHATLGTAQHGGITATISSSDPTRMLVAPNTDTPGAPSITVTIPDGQSSVSYVIQGVEGSTGGAVVSVVAQGFSPGLQNVSVVQPGVELSGLSATMTSLDANHTNWNVRVGLPNAQRTGLQNFQNVRTGAPAFVVTVSVGNAAVARVTSDEPVATAASVTKPIRPDTSFTQALLPGTSGGLGFDPIDVGTTSVTVTGPAGVATMTTNGMRTVTINGPRVVLPGAVTVGAWLQTGRQTANLEAGQHGGVTATITSSDPTRVLVAPNETTPGAASFTQHLDNGQTSISYVVQGIEGTTGAATVSVTAPGFTSDPAQAITVVPIGVELNGLSAAMTSLDANDTNLNVRVGLPNAQGTALQNFQTVRTGGPAFIVTLSVGNASVARVTSDEPVATGASVTKPIRPDSTVTQALLPGTNAGLGFDPIDIGTTTVTAAGPAGVATMATTGVRTVTINGPRLTLPSAVTVGAWLQTGQQTANLEAGQHGGVTVTIASSNPARVLVSPNATTAGMASFTLNLANGQTSIPYFVQGVEGTTGAATVSVTAPGFTSDPAQAITVVPIGVELNGVPTTMTTLDTNAIGLNARVGIPNAQGASLQNFQAVRAGGPAFVLTLTSSNAVVGRVVSDEPPASGASVTKPIQPNATVTQNVSAGTNAGLAFDPLAAGTTILTVTGPAGVMTMTSSGARTVTVNGPRLTLPGAVAVGAWLQTGQQTANLEAGQHGGVTATIASNDPTRVLVSPSATTAGTASFTLNLANGQTSIPYFVQGVEGTTGAATVSVTAPGFTSDPAQNVTVVPIGVELNGVPTTMTTLDTNAIGVNVRVGLPNTLGSSLQNFQAVRAGGPVFVVTLTSSNAAVGRVLSDEPVASGASVTKPIQPNATVTQNVSAGTNAGLAFDPLTAGTTTLTVTGPAGVATMAATGARAITVSGPRLTLPSAVTVGAWLQTGQQTANLEAGQHGGVTATIISSNPARVLVSPNATTAGTASFTVNLANGQTSIPYFVQGVEGTTGAATVAVTAPGFTSDPAQSVTVVPIGVELNGVPATMTSLDTNATGLNVRVGLPNTLGSSLQNFQAVRAGGPAFIVTLSSSNVVVGRVLSDEPVASGASVTKPIQPNATVTQNVSAGTNAGLAFDPLAVGTTTLTVTGPAGVATMAATGVRTVMVNGPRLTLPSAVTVGAWLQTGQQTANLEAGQHGGVTVTIASSDPTRVLVSPNATTAGAASFTVNLANGQTSIPYFVQGVEGTTGTATVSVTAPGFANDPPQSVTVVPSGVEISGLPASIAAGAANSTTWHVRAGLPNTLGSALQNFQSVRAGGPAFIVTLTSSDAAIARVLSDEPVAGGASVTKPIQPNASVTQNASAGTSAGLALDPMAAGTTTITVTGPAGVATMAANGVRTVTVTP